MVRKADVGMGLLVYSLSVTYLASKYEPVIGHF